jgi:hypothetical protein
MTSEPDRSRSRPKHTDAASAVPHTDADVVEVDATVMPVGTFAAGQSDDGRYVAVTAAPQGRFADGQAEEDEATSPQAAATSPEAAATTPEAPPSRAG